MAAANPYPSPEERVDQWLNPVAFERPVVGAAEQGKAMRVQRQEHRKRIVVGCPAGRLLPTY